MSQGTSATDNVGIGVGAHAGLVLAWLGWVGLLILPLLLLLCAVWGTLCWLGTSVLVLLTDGFAEPIRAFERSAGLGILLGMTALLTRWSRKQDGGPSVWMMTCALGLTVLVVRRLHVTLPWALAVGVALCAVTFFLGTGLAALLRGTAVLSRGTYRMGRRSPYAAGAMTVLLSMLCLPGLCALWLIRERGERAEQLLKEAPAPGRIMNPTLRAMLLLTAEAIDPERALRADIRRFLAPLLAEGQAAPSMVRGLPLPVDLLAGPVVSRTDADARFQRCMGQLWPGEVQRAERSIRSFAHLARDELHDVVLAALIDTCETYMNDEIDNLPAYLKQAAVRSAIDGYRRHRLHCQYTEAAPACPTPWESPEEQAAKEAALAQIQWCGLQVEEKALVLEHYVLEMDYQEISNQHPNLTPLRAKDRVNNILKKVRDKLGGQCLRERWRDPR